MRHFLVYGRTRVSLRDRIRDPNIFRVFAATMASGVAFGMALSLLAPYLHKRGLDKRTIGGLATWFAAGVVLLALPMGRLVQKFSAKITLATAFIGYAFTASVFPFLDSYTAIAGVRLLDGAFSVAVWMSSETILLSRVGPGNKGYVMSLYAITMAIGYVLGPLVSRALVTVAPLSAGFLGAGVVAVAAGIFVALTVDRDLPAVPPDADGPGAGNTTASPAGSTRAILWRIKNSCYATFAFGYFQASVVVFLPIFLVEQKGVSTEQTILIPAFFASGMLLFTNLGGRLGDQHGHLKIMRYLASIGMAMTLGFVFLDSFPLMGGAVFVAGATFATMSPLSLALQGVVIHPSEYHRSNALYNAFYASGMLVGPLVSSTIFAHYGGGAMLYHLAAMWLGFVVFSVIFRNDDPAAHALIMRVEPA